MARRAMAAASVWLASAAMAAAAQAQTPSPPPAVPATPLYPAEYHNAERLEERLRALAAAAPDLIRLRRIGRSRLGRPITAALVTNFKVGLTDAKPAAALVGNLDGDEAAAGEAALRTLEFLAAAYAQSPSLQSLLRDRALWVIPRPNPDGTEMLFSTPMSSHGKTFAPRDDDRDGDRDEDGPADLDGDGYALTMRVPSDTGAWVADQGPGADPDLMRLARPGRGERGRFRVLREGLDDDGDGAFNEDGPGGAYLDRNFPIRWRPSHQVEGAGRYPLSEPESRALADFFLGQPSIGLVIHTHIGARALSSGLEEVPKEDAPLFEALRRQFERALEGAEGGRALGAFARPGGARASGSFQDWLYHGLGILAFPARIWTRPPGWSPAEEDDGLDDELRLSRAWLAFFKKQGQGFVPWKAMLHPTLGRVSIGGLTPFTVRTPPGSLLNEAVAPVVRFAINALYLLPEIELRQVTLSALKGPIYKLSFELHNRGFLPTQTARARALKRAAPTIARVELPANAALVQGATRFVLPPIAGRSSVKRAAVVSCAPGASLRLTAAAPRGGRAQAQVTAPGAGQ